MVWYKLKEYYSMIILLQLSIFVFLYNFISELHCWDFLVSMLVAIRAATKTFYIITEISFVASIPFNRNDCDDRWILYRASDKTRSTGSLIIIILSIFSSCTIGIVTTTSDREYRKRRGDGGVASSGLVPLPSRWRVFIIHPSCLRACVRGAAAALNGNVLPAAPSYGRVRFPARA